MADCIFCRIASGSIPSYKIYADDHYLAFLDIFPKTTGHTLVIPKAHTEWVWDVPDLGRFFTKVGEIARHLRQKSGSPVRSLIYGFDVPHAHVHLFPGKTDNLSGKQLSADEMEKTRQRFAV